MKRLTEKHWRNLDPWECCGQDDYCKRGCHEKGGCNNGCIVPRVYARLAAYEDTGRSPEEIQRLTELGSNAPLTLEELREMDGEPVWLVTNTDKPQWAFVVGDHHEEFISFNCADGTEWEFDLYGDNDGVEWLAYRHRPEKEGGC